VTAPAEPLLVDQPTAARMLSVSPSGLRKLTARGTVPSVKLGRNVRYDVADLRRVIEANKTRGSRA
jgi:hypothetical protein